ncbi:MAG TPA: hypothetical protein VFQ85_17140 [Mycobacteriales bacterium]|jgi:hypothetical protein|nr:hypothetical protein [Mycobacteriales bacterium]
MSYPLTVSEARASWPAVLDRALAGEVPLVAAPGGVRAVLLRAELAVLLGAPEAAGPVPRAAAMLRLLVDGAPQRVAVRAPGATGFFDLVAPGVWMQVRESRERFATLLAGAAEAAQGVRRGEEEYAVVDADQLAADLARVWPFAPEVLYEAGGVAVWLPELAVYGRGADLDAATADLLAELRVYADEWQAELRFAPNHRDRIGWVRRIQLARDDAALSGLLDDEPRVA